MSASEAKLSEASTTDTAEQRRTTVVAEEDCGCQAVRIDGYGELPLVKPYVTIEMCTLHEQAEDLQRALGVCGELCSDLLRDGPYSIGGARIEQVADDIHDSLCRAGTPDKPEEPDDDPLTTELPWAAEALP